MMSPAITTYPDLSSARDFVLSWLPEFTFSVDFGSRGQCDALNGITGVNVHFDHLETNRLRFASELLRKTRRISYIVILEHKSAPRSKVRSYKGMFRGTPSIRQGDYTEVEVDLSGQYSHLVGIAKVTGANVTECVELLRDASRAFALVCPEPLLLESPVAQEILAAVPGLPGPAYLNYAPLVARYCSQKCWLVRSGGYSGDGDSDLQFFVPREDVATVEGLIWETLAGK